MSTRKLCLTLLLAALTVIVMIGCGTDDPKPSITRLYASSTCGVAPLRVDFRADATGGASMPEPTGGNNWLRMRWDFGDGTVIENGTSIAFHQYQEAGSYLVTITAEDDNGDTASDTTRITVQPDSLGIQVYGLVDDQPADEIETCRPLQLGVLAETCDFDTVEDSYERFVFLWTVGNTVYRGTNPQHSFADADVGEQEITVVVEDPTRSITRFDTLRVNVVASEGADLSLAADWLASPQGSAADTLRRDVTTFPDTLIYTIHLRNDGPADAYNVVVEGHVAHNRNRCFYESGVVSSGDISYVAAEGNTTIKLWTWNVPLIASGGEETADISFYVEIGTVSQAFGFGTEIQTYACDPDTAGNSVRPVMILNSVP